jgi:hypothetical protein
MYHYKTKTILAIPIPGLNSNSILKAFKKNFEYLEEKGYKPKLNVMDYQAKRSSKLTLLHNKLASNLLNHITIASTLQKEPSKRSRIASSGLWARPTPTSPSSHGTNLPHRCKTSLTYFVPPAYTLTACLQNP